MARQKQIQYVDFQKAFRGYDFFHNEKKEIVPKYIMWIKYKNDCINMSILKHSSSEFSLIDREGWRDGKRKYYETD